MFISYTYLLFLTRLCVRWHWSDLVVRMRRRRRCRRFTRCIPMMNTRCRRWQCATVTLIDVLSTLIVHLFISFNNTGLLVICQNDPIYRQAISIA